MKCREKARAAWMSERAVQIEKPLTGEDLFWVVVLVLGLPLMIWLGGGHIGG